METLTTNIIKKIFEEEIEKKLESDVWGKKLSNLKKELDVYSKKEDAEPKKTIVSPGLEIRDRSGNLYTVSKIEDDFMWLETPQGKHIKVGIDRLKDFKVD